MSSKTVLHERISDWFEHWATKKINTVFLCEYGVPFSWDWTMYRGWYKGERSFSAKVPWEFCLAEWNAQFFGERAYQISEREKQNLRFEAAQFKKGNLWHRWDYPHQVGARDFDERQAIFAQYIADNWRAHRTWGLSANSPWEYHVFWKLKDGAIKGRKEFKVDWEQLQLRLQSRLHATPIRGRCPLTTRRPTGYPPPRHSPSIATTVRCWLTSAARSGASRARTTIAFLA